MKPIYKNGHVVAKCPDCKGSVVTFEFKDPSREYGYINKDGIHDYNGKRYNRITYRLLSCASCGRGAIVKFHGGAAGITIEEFFPFSIDKATIPSSVPKELNREFREAEICASFGAYRASSALLRSTLEKILEANGYSKGKLQGKIDEAAKDGIITDSRKKRAHEDIRVLGNDVLHDEWRMIEQEEVEKSHHYIQRIFEDFYDDRDAVESILIDKKRFAQPNT